jgi:periplasmic protein TonB
MAKDINLNASAWCDLVFEGKNKNYGAYIMRLDSARRHMVALFVTMGLIIFIIFLPLIISTVKKLTAQHEKMEDRTIMADLAKLEDRVKEENIERVQDVPPTPPLKSTVKFTAPVITEEPIEEGEELMTMDELSNTKSQISIANVKGDDEVNGVDIIDLDNHKIEVQADEPTYVPEQMPQFPGGEEALMEFLNENLRYPAQAENMGIAGRVTVRFVVNREGVVSNVQVMRSLDPSCDKEAMRIVKIMPNWIPGRQNGRAVDVYYVLPILFKLNN